MNLDPSSLIQILLPTITAGKSKSWRMLSWTLVRARLLGHFCQGMLHLACGLGQDSTLSDHHHVFAAELPLQPLLYALERPQQGHWHDDHSALSVTNIHLFGASDSEFP